MVGDTDCCCTAVQACTPTARRRSRGKAAEKSVVCDADSILCRGLIVLRVLSRSHEYRCSLRCVVLPVGRTFPGSFSAPAAVAHRRSRLALSVLVKKCESIILYNTPLFCPITRTRRIAAYIVYSSTVFLETALPQADVGRNSNRVERRGKTSVRFDVVCPLYAEQGCTHGTRRVRCSSTHKKSMYLVA